MNLVFVHGRSQGGKNPVELERTWMQAFRKGLKTAGVTEPSALQVHFPFYGDELDQMLERLDSPLLDDVRTRGATVQDKELAFRERLLSEMREARGISNETVEQAYDGPVRERGVLNWEWVQSILKVLDPTELGRVAIDRFTRDVYVYLTVPAIRRRIDSIVKDSLPDGPSVVVGHSLGSVVTYNVLRDEPRDRVVYRYVTVGSPLGLQTIKDHLSKAIAMPDCVRGWHNAYDEADVVALKPLDERHFNVTPSILNKNNVRNHTKNHHGIIGYLDDPVVAKWIAELFCSN